MTASLFRRWLPSGWLSGVCGRGGPLCVFRGRGRPFSTAVPAALGRQDGARRWDFRCHGPRGLWFGVSSCSSGSIRVTEAQSQQRFWEHDSQPFPALAFIGWTAWESGSRLGAPASAATPDGRARWAVVCFPRSWPPRSEPQSPPRLGAKIRTAGGI